MNAVPRQRGAPIRSISAVLPARNDAANLMQVVEGLLDALIDVVPSFEVIVVDDGSIDASRRIAEELASTHPEVRVVHFSRPRGYGVAVREGLAAATKQYTLFLDPDRRYNPADIEHLVKWDDAYDIVAGFRLKRADSATRRLLGVFFRLGVRLLFGLKQRDVNCGFKLVRTSLAKSLTLQSTSIVVDTEIFVRSAQANAQVREVGVRHYRRPPSDSFGTQMRMAIRAGRELIALKRVLNNEQRQATAAARALLEAAQGAGAGSKPVATGRGEGQVDRLAEHTSSQDVAAEADQAVVDANSLHAVSGNGSAGPQNPAEAQQQPGSENGSDVSSGPTEPVEADSDDADEQKAASSPAAESEAAQPAPGGTA